MYFFRVIVKLVYVDLNFYSMEVGITINLHTWVHILHKNLE